MSGAGASALAAGRRSESGSRVRWVKVWVVLVIGAGGCDRSPGRGAGEERADPKSRTNVLLISLCSVRADHLGCYGYGRKTSPALDKLAGEATVFERAVAQWPKTVPSFVSMHTGLYPHTTGVMRVTPGHRLDDSYSTLAEILGAAGYRTAAYVSSPPLNKTLNLNQGFGEYYETYRRPGGFEQTGRGASGWLKVHGEEPFFLWVHFNNAHVPYRPPGDLHGKFVDDAHYDSSRRVRINSKSDGLSVEPEHPFARQISRADLGGVVADFALRHEAGSRPTELDYYVAEYDAAILGADRLIGELLATVEELGLGDRTAVVLVGDHGESLGEHDYYFEHGRLPYEACQRVPLMIRAPGLVPAGHRVADPVALIDVAPTVLELAGMAAPENIEGRSLLPVVRGEAERGDVFFCAGYHLDFLTGVRRDRWKLVRVSNPLDRQIMTGNEYELYDVIADPMEENNVYDSRGDVADPMKRRLEEWIEPWWSRVSMTVASGPVPEMDEETKTQMGTLGYTSGGSDDEDREGEERE